MFNGVKNIEQIKNVKLLESEKSVKRDRDLAYLMELKTKNLLFSYYTEAGLNGLLRERLSEMVFMMAGIIRCVRSGVHLPDIGSVQLRGSIRKQKIRN